MPSAIIRKSVALFVAIAAAALPFFVPPAARADGAGTGTGVARISLIAGDVAIQRGDSAAPVAAAINAPLLGADYLKTGPDSRAEIQFDGTSMVRLGSGVQMRFTHLDGGDRALQLAQGTIELRLMRAVDGTYAVDTPSISVRAHQSGIYRVSVTDDGQTMVTVRSGEAEIVTPQDDRTLDPGTTLIARGAATNPTLQSATEIAYDDFDRFNKDRDDRHEHALADASSYVNPNLDGIDALDGYGRWVNDGSYGQVWTPYNAGAGWAPYRDGRWVWEDRFGWTWVAYEPWGWAPYHYGRWYRSAAYGWCWYPPQPFGLLPIWQPGLVAFLTFGGGNIGWVPLAPFEPYYPWRGYGYGYPNVTNVTNVTNVYNVYDVYGPGTAGNVMIRRFYKNARFGTTAQPGTRFLLGKFDHPVRVSPAQLAHAQLVKGTLPVVPTAANLRFTETPVARKLLTGAPSHRPLFAGDTIVARRIPFERQRESLATGMRVRAALVTGAREPATIVTGARAPATIVTGARTPATIVTGGGTPATGGSAQRAASPWRRFDTSRAPDVIVGGAERTGVKAAAPPVSATHPVSAIPAVPVSNSARGASDPWSRFVESGAVTRDAPGAARRAPANGSPEAHRQIDSMRGSAAPRERTVTAPAERAAPVERMAPAERAAPVERRAPQVRVAPLERTVTVPAAERPAGTPPSANRSAPAHANRSAPTHA